MSTQEFEEEHFLPKEPLEIPAHLRHEQKPVEHTTRNESAHSHRNQQPQIKTLLAWHAPGRPFIKRSRQFYITSLMIMFLLEIIVYIVFKEYLLMLLIASFVFAAFSFSLVPPHNLYYRVSTEGITIEDHFFLWQELYDFYFKKRNGEDILYIRTHAYIPGELMLMLGDITKEHIKTTLLPYLPYREVIRATFMEKSGDWLTKTFPLESPQKAR